MIHRGRIIQTSTESRDGRLHVTKSIDVRCDEIEVDREATSETVILLAYGLDVKVCFRFNFNKPQWRN